MHTKTILFLLAAIALWTPMSSAIAAEEATDLGGECMACHEDAALTKTVAGKTVSLAIDNEKFQDSVHGILSCTDCHTGIEEVPHADKLPTAQCASCHDEITKEYRTSIHGVSHAMGGTAAAGCADCHGSHYIMPVKHSDSPVFKLNLPRTCANCHSNPGLTSEYRMKFPQAAAQYQESIHGRALMQMGLIVAPSCNDCHGIHDIRRTVDRTSPIHHLNIAKTCGKCHLKTEQIYNASVHGQLLGKSGDGGPVCSDCHTAHEIEAPRNGHFKRVSDKRCGSCHQDRLKYYHETYHGKAMELSRPNVAADVAACYDCHGHHDVFPPSDPRSRLSPDRIVSTCQQCHAGATRNFTQYLSHANPLDKEHYPGLHKTFVFMTALLVSVFGFFGIHTVLWLIRSGYFYLHDSKGFRKLRKRAKNDTEWFTRFTPFERFLHALVVTSFLLLVMTGMPLKFYYTDWAKALFDILGGAEVARWLHHFGAIITFLYFGLHLLSLVVDIILGRKRFLDPATGKFKFKRVIELVFGPDSMIPNLQDCRDFVAHVKSFIGKGPQPQFDRWAYWEKFDYFAVFWGVFMIGLSGLIMWFPQFFTSFMPGWIINVALIVHSDEALLAAGFIFMFHFFNVHFRPERLPMDPVIFSGRISRAEMLHERKRWFDRLTTTGTLEQTRIKDEWDRWHSIAGTFGYVFFSIGVILLILIIYAMMSRLGH